MTLIYTLTYMHLAILQDVIEGKAVTCKEIFGTKSEGSEPMIYANDFDYTPNKDNAFSKMGV
jgi:hypothetical protein